MSKYIIDLIDDCNMVQQVCVTENGNVYTKEEYAASLEELTADYINEHFSDLQDTAYQRGFEKGKDVRIKGCEGCMYQDTTIEHNPCNLCCNAFLNRWTAKDDKIEVGDEVIYIEHKFIVFATETEEHYASLFDVNGRHASASQRECKKTGRHFDIASILEDMRHD